MSCPAVNLGDVRAAQAATAIPGQLGATTEPPGGLQYDVVNRLCHMGNNGPARCGGLRRARPGVYKASCHWCGCLMGCAGLFQGVLANRW